MNVAKTYGDVVRGTMDAHPDRALSLIKLGLHAESFRTGRFPDKQMPAAYRFLNHMAIKVVADALEKPETFAWTNIFAPVEILESFGLSCVSMECMASYLSGFWIEDSVIDACEASGFSPTLCTYHRAFIGACEAGILPRPACGVTTSMICDGNVNTFRYLGRKYGLPVKLLDVPDYWSAEGEEYLVGQLKELVSALERITGRSYDEDALREALRRENESKELYRAFLEKRKVRAYPDTLTLRLFTMFATHLSIGSEWALEFFRLLESDIGSYAAYTGKRLFWVHLTPYSQPTLSQYLNYSGSLAIVGDDLNLDYMEPLDIERPLHALARKMICNIYNGGFERKMRAIERYVIDYECDGVVEFCHWGCKQSAGGAQLLKQRMREIGVPMLILDGDGIDRRNAQDGQIKTRFEAFLEVLAKGSPS